MIQSAVRLHGVELRWLGLRLRTPHVSSRGAELERPVVVARVDTDRGDGWGECAAFAAPTYSEEFAEGAWSVLVDHLIPLLLEAARDRAGRLPFAQDMAAVLSSVRGNAMAKACLEMAVLDAELRAANQSLADRLVVRRDSVQAGAVVGISDGGDPGPILTLLDQVEGLAAQGYTRVKVKICPGDDLRTLKAVRRAFPDLGLQADANGAYRLDDPDHLTALEALDDLDLLCVEQPLDPDDLAGHSRLAEDLETPVCLDESISSLGRLRDAIALRACDMVCVKPARMGGLLQAVAAHDVCVAAAIPAWCGGMLETSLARSANAAVAGLPGFVLPGDLAGGERFVEPDPFLAGAGPAVPRLAQAVVTVQREPGVGPIPVKELLDLLTIRRHWAPMGSPAG